MYTNPPGKETIRGPTNAHSQQPPELNVFNLSSMSLKSLKAQLSVLNSGLSFLPSSPINDFEIKTDSFRFLRNIKQRATHKLIWTHWGTSKTQRIKVINDNNPQREITPFRSKSYFVPPANREASVDTYCN